MKMKKMEAYRELSAHRGTSWIANVFLTNSGTRSRRECTKAMVKMAQFVREGHEFNTASFEMPTISFIMNGYNVKFEDFIKPEFEYSDAVESLHDREEME